MDISRRMYRVPLLIRIVPTFYSRENISCAGNLYMKSFPVRTCMKDAVPTETRPWGSFTVIHGGEGFKVKELRVGPGMRLSYQSHEHRRERWVVVKGRAEVLLDGKMIRLAPGEVVMVEKGSRHRLMNPGPEELIVIEVQLGDILEEEDIIRYEDDFNRVH